jgi:MFS family permease
MDRTVLKYYAFEVTRSAHLSGPIWVVFLLSRNVSYTGVGALDAVFSLTVLLAEVPTGWLGDRFGRRRSLLVGQAVGAAGSVAFAFGRSLAVFAVLYALLAVGQTLRSGSDSAWLYDTLRARTDEAAFARIRGRGRALGLATAALAALAGGVVGSVDLALPWLLSGALTALGVPVVASFPRAPTGGEPAGVDGATGTGDADEQRADDGGTDPDDASDEDGAPGTFAAFRTARDRLFAPELRWFVLYTGLFAAAMGAANYFVQPVTLEALPPLSVPVGGYTLDRVALLGVVYAGFTGVAAVATAASGRIEAALGAAGWFRLAPVGLGLALAVVAVLPVLAVPAFFLLRAIRELTDPLQGQYLNDRTPSLGRATTLSAVAMVHALVVAPFEVAAGLLADRVGPTDAVAVIGAGLLLVALSAAALGRLATGGRPFGTDRARGD